MIRQIILDGAACCHAGDGSVGVVGLGLVAYAGGDIRGGTMPMPFVGVKP